MVIESPVKKTRATAFEWALLLGINLLSIEIFFSEPKIFAATHYVWQSSPSPTAPYTNWATAAHVIQEAVDAGVPDDEIVVTNGIYATGNQAMFGNNRVAVDKPMAVRSVNGPQVTMIQGYPVPGTTNGDGAIRCVYLTNGASLSGFTLTDGATLTNNWSYGGGVFCDPNAVVSNCVLVRNTACEGGGGAFQGILKNCTLSGNSAATGGGARDGILNACAVTGNSAYGGGGTYYCSLTNCTVTGNTARSVGGGTYAGSLVNCIVYHNVAAGGANYSGSGLDYCCTTPLPVDGTGNLEVDPQLASSSHISATSPCRGTGTIPCTSDTDNDGEVWANPPSIGCDEYHIGAVTGPLSADIMATFTNVAVNYPVSLTARIEGRATRSEWELGDGSVATNCPYASHAWTTPGEYSVVLRAYNESFPQGVRASVTIRVQEQPVHYVAAESTAPEPPYASWSVAAANIQDAVDAATLPGALVLVSNGVYATGGYAVYGAMTNRLAVTKPVIVCSVNGPTETVIRGYQVPGTTNGDAAIRCVCLSDGASLFGFTLTNGATRTAGDWLTERNGGGLWCESASSTISNCVVLGNSAARQGGGVFLGSLRNCSVIGNVAAAGGGASIVTLDNCTVASNSAISYGGGTLSSVLRGCSLSGNSSGRYGGGGAFDSTLNNCSLISNSVSGFDARGGGACAGMLTSCTLIGNSANGENASGGGAYSSALSGCTLLSNSSVQGGGAAGGTLLGCCLSSNSAWNGGGAAGATLKRCTLTGNSAANEGGAVGLMGPDPGRPAIPRESTLESCIIAGNFASNGAGVCGGTLNNCLISSNWATNYGGGACGYPGSVVGSGWVPALLNNCTIVDNTAQTGAGVFEGTVKNSIIYFNNAPTNANSDSSTLDFCCTLPFPAGLGNITNAPLFVNPAGGDLRLQSNSPCINSGFHSFVSEPTDLDGNPRIVSSTVDIGAYEYQGSGSLISYAWLQHFALPTDGSADYTDADADGHNNWQEWRCQTNPTNALSALKLISALPTENGVTVTWQSISGVGYFLERSTDLFHFSTIVTNISGHADLTSYDDINVAPSLSHFYRVGVGY